MYYPVIVHKDRNSDYGVIAPDFPGVFSGGESLDEALANVHDALETWFCDDEVCRMPVPSALVDVLASEDAANGAVVLVSVDPGAYGRKMENLVNVPLPEELAEKLDALAASAGKSRAEYLAALLA